jgi:hypothetical protein
VSDAAPAPYVRRRRGRWIAAGAAVAVVAAVVAVITARPARPRPTGGDGGYPTATAPVARRTLTSRTQVDATLGYAGAYTVVNRARGTLTALPRPGSVVRQGRVLYRVDGRPVVLLYGPVPAYRTLAYGASGRDVAALNAALVTLGYTDRARLDPASDDFGATTAAAVVRLQRHLRVTRTGTLALGDAVFLPGAARITRRGGVLGGTAQPGATVLAATSTTPAVTIKLDAAQRTEVAAGDRVTIALPSGRDIPGTVSSVGSVASKPARDGTSTIDVTVTPAHLAAARGLDQAPVRVSITTGRVRHALVVPVAALLSRPGGTYAVEVAGPGTHRHLIPATPGLFDDASGLVQLTAPGLTPGQHVVLPAA